MKAFKKACEVGFGKIAGWSFHHKWLALLLVAVISASLMSQLPTLTVDTSNEGFFRPDDQVLVDYNNFRDQYGKDEFIILAIAHPDIFSLEFLEELKRFHLQLEADVPYIDELTSLINIRNSRGEGDELIVEDFLEKWPQNQTDLKALQQRAEDNTLYTNFILSEDKQMTAIIIKPIACNPESDQLLQTEGSCPPMTNGQNREMMAAMHDVVDEFSSESFPIAVSGMPAVIDHLNTTLEKDLSIIIPSMYLMVIVFLGIIFRRISAMIYPVIIFFLSLISTIALMAILNIPMTNITVILPSFMLVVSISDAIHILALFYPEYQKSGDRKQAIIAAMEHSGLAILMTTITTACGLFSFAVADIAPVADLGIVAPIGVFLALLYTVLLLPALLSIFPVKIKPAAVQRTKTLDSIFCGLSSVACSYRWIIISVFGLLLVVFASGATQLQFSHLALRWFQEGSIIRLDTELIDDKMRGSVSLDIIIDTGKVDGLYDPEFISSLEEATKRYSTYEYQDLFVGKILDLTTILKETNRALHENRAEYYTVPDNGELIAQELFLFQLSGSDDLDELVDQQFSQTRLAMHLPYRDSFTFKRFVEFVEADLTQRFPECSITVTGVNALFIEMLNNVMLTMVKSYSLAIVLISVLMIFMLGRLRMGLISMIPNLFPIIAVLGLMGWFKVPLDFGTILIGSISIGIIVDDTIHFLHNYSRYYEQTHDPQQATERSLHTVGRAMLATSVVLVGGFLCNMFSGLTLNQYSGFLVASTIVIALITDFLLTPAILSLVYGKKVASISPVEVTS